MTGGPLGMCERGSNEGPVGRRLACDNAQGHPTLLDPCLISGSGALRDGGPMRACPRRQGRLGGNSGSSSCTSCAARQPCAAPTPTAQRPRRPRPPAGLRTRSTEPVPGTNGVAPAEQMNRAPGGGAPSTAGDSQPPDADAECAEDTGAGGNALRHRLRLHLACTVTPRRRHGSFSELPGHARGRE